MVKGESKCEAHNCSSVKKTSPELTFHRFPKLLRRARQWAIKCGRFDFLGKDKINTLHIQYSLCSLHFETDCFLNDLKNSLTKTAIPTLFQAVDTHEELQLSLANPQQQVLEQVYYDEASGAYYAVTPRTAVSHIATQTEDAPTWNGVTYEKGTFSMHYRQKLCRLCANVIHDSDVVFIFGKSGLAKDLSRKINRILPFSDHVEKSDYLPQWICRHCCKRVDACDEIIDLFLAANSKLKGMLISTKTVGQQNVNSVLNVDSLNFTHVPYLKAIQNSEELQLRTERHLLAPEMSILKYELMQNKLSMDCEECAVDEATGVVHQMGLATDVMAMPLRISISPSTALQSGTCSRDECCPYEKVEDIAGRSVLKSRKSIQSATTKNSHGMQLAAPPKSITLLKAEAMDDSEVANDTHMFMQEEWLDETLSERTHCDDIHSLSVGKHQDLINAWETHLSEDGFEDEGIRLYPDSAQVVASTVSVIQVDSSPRSKSLKYSPSIDISFASSPRNIVQESVKTVVMPIKKSSYNIDNQTSSKIRTPKLIKTFTTNVLNNSVALSLDETDVNEDYGLCDTRYSSVNKVDEIVSDKGSFVRLHTLMSGTPDNRNFLCRVCNVFFVSIEDVLNHRFKEHTEQEIYNARIKLQK